MLPHPQLELIQLILHKPIPESFLAELSDAFLFFFHFFLEAIIWAVLVDVLILEVVQAHLGASGALLLCVLLLLTLVEAGEELLVFPLIMAPLVLIVVVQRLLGDALDPFIGLVPLLPRINDHSLHVLLPPRTVHPLPFNCLVTEELGRVD